MSRHHTNLNRRRWTAAHKQVLDRDGWRCSKCGRAGRLEVHRRKPLDGGGDPYDPDNLAVLCRGCHIDEHPRPVPEPVAAWRRLVAQITDP